MKIKAEEAGVERGLDCSPVLVTDVLCDLGQPCRTSSSLHFLVLGVLLMTTEENLHTARYCAKQ